ncbi:uncharacterized protein LOC127033094 [Gopherus flavomarginatus]|uniref:uncharacterized protein LOC127033094 n=1 Tax=Gopherus flavomarginatus TaxID=286002 RepID=UPI0021CBFF67|nr:uncharacterized protein LOC127033094 [Gopherus flavomarginatus]
MLGCLLLLRRRELTGAVEGLTGRLAATEEKLRSLQGKTGGWAPEDAGIPSAPEEGPSREGLLGVLAQCLHSKEAALQDCLAALESLAPPGAEPPAPESLAPHLCRRLKERDQVLERILADHFLERGRLQGALRDKDQDLGQLAAALRTGEQTLHALRETLEQKELERAQLASLCAMAQDAWRRQDQTRALALKEMEELVAALQAALASSNKDLEVLAESRAAPAPVPAPALLQRLREQEGLLAEALAARARLAAEMEARLQGALAAQVAAEQQLQTWG